MDCVSVGDEIMATVLSRSDGGAMQLNTSRETIIRRARIFGPYACVGPKNPEDTEFTVTERDTQQDIARSEKAPTPSDGAEDCIIQNILTRRLSVSLTPLERPM